MMTTAMTASYRDDLLFNLATFEKFTLKGLSELLTESKVTGRSKAKTREQKIQLLMIDWGYTAEEIAEATAPEPENPEPEIDSHSAEIEAGDRAADSDLEICLPHLAPIARRWLSTCQSMNPDIITMIAYVSFKGAPTNYICYASDARKLSRAIGQPHGLIELRDYSIPVFYLAKTEFGMYADQLSRMGIAIEIV